MFDLTLQILQSDLTPIGDSPPLQPYNMDEKTKRDKDWGAPSSSWFVGVGWSGRGEGS